MITEIRALWISESTFSLSVCLFPEIFSGAEKPQNFYGGRGFYLYQDKRLWWVFWGSETKQEKTEPTKTN